MPVSGQVSLECNYCGVKTESVDLQTLGNLTDWFILSPAQSIGEPIGHGSIAICRKCKLKIDELGRIVRWKAKKKFNPAEVLLPEDDLPDTSFIDGIADPNIACIGTNSDKETLPDAMKFVNPAWTKKPAVKEETDQDNNEWIGE